jgi:17 kDa outer membrane surface antigen
MRSRSVVLAVAVVAAALSGVLALGHVPPVLAQQLRLANPAPLLEEAPAPPLRPRADEQELDDTDEVAAFDAIRIALSEVGDGVSYVWHRNNGRLSGVIHPTASFKDASGRVCRHIVLVLTTGVRSARIEGVACRLVDGRWQLEG